MINVLYILRSLVYAQSFLWLYLIDKDYEVKSNFIKVLFPACLGILLLTLDMIGFSFSQYTNDLLMFYVFLMLYAFLYMRLNYSFYDSVCFTFLLVFINSYYWEFILHLNVIVFYGLNLNQFIQAFHLIPAYILYKKLWIINTIKFKKILLIGLIVSALNLMELNIFPNHLYLFGRWIFLRQIVNYVTRFICLNILLYVISKNTLIKKVEDITFPFLDNRPN